MMWVCFILCAEEEIPSLYFYLIHTFKTHRDILNTGGLRVHASVISIITFSLVLLLLETNSTGIKPKWIERERNKWTRNI